MQIAGNTFLVSGGSSGLGAACVRMLAEAGASVVIIDVNEDKGNALAAELGERVRFVKTDVTSESSVQSAIRLAEESFGNVRGSIQCAGIGLAERLLGKTGAHSLESFSKVIAVNLIGTFNVARLAAEAINRVNALPSGERGVIINTASIAAFEGQIGQVAYSASKGGVASMTLPMARELARWGIRVVTIAPGIFDTPLLAGLPEATRVSLGQQVPFPPRLGRPEEYAQLARQVIENEMLNGTVLRLDGALRMAPK